MTDTTTPPLTADERAAIRQRAQTTVIVEGTTTIFDSQRAVEVCGRDIPRLLDALDAAERERRELRVALLNLVAAFADHRTKTHRTAPRTCLTCQESAQALEAARVVLEGRP